MTATDKLINTWERQLSSFPLNDLSSAHNLIGGFQAAVESFCAAVRDYEYDTSVAADAADALIDLAYGLEEAADEAEHDVAEMVGAGWADEGYEDRVQERLEEVTDKLADALAAYRSELEALTTDRHTEERNA